MERLQRRVAAPVSPRQKATLITGFTWAEKYSVSQTPPYRQEDGR